MAVSEEYLKHILDQLSEFGEINAKKMFGGIGLFCKGTMFGKIGNNTLRLKVDSSNQKEYEAYRMKPFYSKKKNKGMPYWEVPIDIINDRNKLTKWVEKSYKIALKTKK